jgi:hypothetical protein
LIDGGGLAGFSMPPRISALIALVPRIEASLLDAGKAITIQCEVIEVLVFRG